MALGMFTDLCLVLVLLVAGLLVPKFHFNYIWSESFNSLFCTLIKNSLLTKENARYNQTLLKICYFFHTN